MGECTDVFSAAALTAVMASVEDPPKIETEEPDHDAESQLEPDVAADSSPSGATPSEPETAIWHQEDCDLVSTPWKGPAGIAFFGGCPRTP